MRTQNVSRGARLVGYVIIGATIVVVIGAPVLFCPIQQLQMARIGLTGQVDSPIDRPVTLVAQLPRGYGLTASELRAGLPELNERHLAEVVLDGSAFEVQLPPARYCMHRFWWQRMPPPPMWLTLRFSDAPDEEYIVWATGRRSLYFVRDANGVERSKARASWRLHVGGVRSEDPDALDAAWLLEIRLERLDSETPPNEDESANA